MLKKRLRYIVVYRNHMSRDRITEVDEDPCRKDVTRLSRISSTSSIFALQIKERKKADALKDLLKVARKYLQR